MRTKKRILSMLLTVCLIVGMLPQTAFATEGATIGASGLCEHHTAHDDTCGYVEGTAETPCAHDHTEDCYEIAKSCTHTHTEDCYPVMDSGVSGNEATPSDAAEPICGHECSEESGCITKELNCTHTEHDGECGYIEAVEASPCTYECALCALTEITAWSWIDEWEMLDPDTGVLALPGASERNPAYFDDIVSMLPVEITATVEGGTETVALDGWACPGYPEEGAYSGNYIFTATLPEGYTLAEDAPELTVTVELGGAAVYAEDTTTHENGLKISGGVLGTDFSFTDEVLCYTGKKSTGNAADSAQGGIKILSSTPLTLSGTMTQNGNYTGIYIPSNVEAHLTLNVANIGGGNHTAPITVEGTLYLTLTGSNVITPYDLNAGTTVISTAGIWVLENGSLEITEQSTGSLTITASYENPAIGQTRYATSDVFGTNYVNQERVNKAGSITINGGQLTLISEGSKPGDSRSYNSGAAIGSAAGGDFTSITINGGIIDAESYTGAAIGAGWRDDNFSAPDGSVTINGGTINATGGQGYTSDGVGGSTDAIAGGVTIKGGSVKNAANYNRPTDGTNGLYLATITLDGVTSATAITEVKYYVGTTETTYGTGNVYAYTDMQTDTSGNLYLWLPEGAVVSSVRAGTSSYTGNLLVQDDDSAEGTFYTGTTNTVSLASSYSNVNVSLPYGNQFAEGATVYVQVVADTGYAVTGVDTTENPSSYTWVDGNIYSFTMPSNAVTVYATAQQVNLPETLDLSYGDITFGYNTSLKCRYLTYYAASGGELQTVNYIPAGQTYTITQSNSSSASTANTIKVVNWDDFSGDELPLKLTISNLNINADTGEEGSESLSENLIDIDNSTVELTLDGTSTLTSNVPYSSTVANNRMQALLGVDSASELTITQASGSNELTVTALTGFGASIGGDGASDSDNSQACGIINIKGGKIAATIGKTSLGQGAAIGGGRYGTGGTVNISGGEVTATCYGTGTAIGSGAMGTGFTVNISGGTVTAKNTYAYQSGAAIGSGQNGTATVTISGGDIDTIVSNSYAPAIGSGYGTGDGANAIVSIIGGNINIDNVTEATIGKGSNSKATVTITGGSVNGTKYNGASITDGTNEVYLITADLSDTVGGSKAVTGNITNGTYSFDGVKTNSAGKIYLWLPGDGTTETKAVFNGGNYTGTVKTDNTGTFKADKPSPTVTAPTANSWTYDSTTQALVTAGETSGGTLQYALGSDSTTAPGDDSWGTAVPTGTDAEDYFVWYRVVGDDEYADVAATCVPVTISQRAISVKADDQTVLVNGTPDPTKITVSGDGLASGHDITVTFGTVDTAATGTATLTIDTVTINGASDSEVTGNYAITKQTGTLTIQKHEHEWTYTGSGDTITATCRDSDNNCDDPVQTIQIKAPAALDYDGQTKTATLSGSISGVDNPAITYTAAEGSSLTGDYPINAGTYTASITLEEAKASTTFTIKKIAASVATVPTAINPEYNGNAQNLITAGTPTGGEMQYSLDGTDYSTDIPTRTAAGDYTVYYKVVGDSNHNDTAAQTITAKILKATAPVVVPREQTIAYGQHLSSISLPSGWKWVNENAIPDSSTGYAAYLEVDDTNYNYEGVDGYDSTTHRVTWEIQVMLSTTTPAITVQATPASAIAGKTITVSATVKNPHNESLSDLPTPTYTYKVGDSGEETEFTGSFIIPESTLTGTTITIKATTAANDKYAVGTGTATVIVTDCTHTGSKTLQSNTASHWYVCGECSAEIDKAAHSGGTATCTETAKCATCNQPHGDVDSTNHTGSTAWEYDATHHWGKCACGAELDKEAHSGGTATCKDKATCTDCKQPYGSTDSSNHTGGTEVRGKVDATTTSTGYTGDTYCLGCNTKIKTGTTIPKKDSGGNTGGNTGGGDSGNDDSGDDTPTVPDNGDDTPSDTPTTSVTVPVSGDEKSIQVGASVSGTKATIENIDFSTLNTVIGDDVRTGVVKINFAVLNVEVDTVEIPADVVKQIAAAANNPNNDAESLEIVLTDGTSIEFDAKALGEKSAQAGGIDITISIKRTTDSVLNTRQQAAVGGRTAFDINVTSGGRHISDIGGKVSVHAPYELRPGEKAEGIKVYYVDDNGNKEACETSYDSTKKRVNWKTDHLSVYMIGYEEPKINPDTGGEETPKSPETGDNTPAYVTYTVQKGDTLWAIANKYGCTVSDIVAANSDLIKNPNLIYAGWQLKIPQGGTTGADITAPDAILPEDKKTGVYIVKRGDTLWAISKKYGCTVAEIVALNGELITDPDLIFAGWELKMPQD